VIAVADDEMSYVCAFRGRRDAYEVPLALAESGRLDRFITDVFMTPAIAACARLLPARARGKMAERAKPGIPPDRVRCLLGETLLENGRHESRASPADTYMRFDAMYSRAARARRATRKVTSSLYSPYAMPAFARATDHRPLKVLFQFHPHARLESSILAEDRARWPSLRFTDRIVRETAPASRPITTTAGNTPTT
jgi:hypothetical protein